MKVELRYFGMLAEETACSREQIEVDPGVSIQTVLNLLEERYPTLRDKLFSVALDMEISPEETLLEKECELALLPAFAGG